MKNHKYQSDKRIDNFIFNSVEAGYTCILIGESHDGQTGLESLSEIAGQLKAYSEKTNTQFVIFDEIDAADEMLPIPLSSEDIPDKKKKEHKEYLSKNGISVFGLENKRTGSLNVVVGSKNEVNNFLKEIGVFEICMQGIYSKFLPEIDMPEDLDEAEKGFIRKFQDEGFYSAMMLDRYTYSDYRITRPNKEWSEYIRQIPQDIVCLVVVGCKHIPCATRDNQLIDIGLQQRLGLHRKTISTYIVEVNSDVSAPYFPKIDSGLEFSPMMHVSYAAPNLQMILDKIDQLIKNFEGQLDEKSGIDKVVSMIPFIGENKIIKSLVNLKGIIYNLAKSNSSHSISNLLNAWLDKNEVKNEVVQLYFKNLCEELGNIKLNELIDGRRFREAPKAKTDIEISGFSDLIDQLDENMVKDDSTLIDILSDIKDNILTVSNSQMAKDVIFGLLRNYDGYSKLSHLKTLDDFIFEINYYYEVQASLKFEHGGLINQYHYLVTNEDDCVRKINKLLRSNTYLNSEEKFSRMIKHVEPLMSKIASFREQQCNILSNVLNQDSRHIKELFFKTLFLSKGANDAQAITRKILDFTNKYLVAENALDSKSNDNDLSANVRYRYVNSLIRRYLMDMDDASLIALTNLLEESSIKISIDYNKFETEVIPLDDDNAKCVNKCVRNFNIKFDQEMLSGKE